MLNGRVPDKERIKRSNNGWETVVHDFQTMTLGIRLFSFHITHSFSFFKGNGLKTFICSLLGRLNIA